jgi:hypothetical protein
MCGLEAFYIALGYVNLIGNYYYYHFIVVVVVVVVVVILMDGLHI